MMERLGLDEENYIESGIVGKTIESAQTPRRGLQLRHPQARRRVRRRHQPPARDDLRRARQGPPQRGPDRHDPGLPGRGPRRGRRAPPRGANEAATEEGVADLVVELNRMGIGADHVKPEELLELRSASEIAEHLKRRRGRDARGEGEGGRAGGVGHDRAVRPAADHRLAVGRAPDRGRRHAPGHRAPRLRPAGPAERVPEGGVPALRGAVRVHPAPGREHDLPGPDPAQPHVHTQDGVFPMPGPGQQGRGAAAGRGRRGATEAPACARAFARRQARASRARPGSPRSPARPVPPRDWARASRRGRATRRAGRRSAATTRAGAAPG